MLESVVITPINKFWQDWRADAEVAVLCERLFLHMADVEHRLEHFSYSNLKQATHANNDEKLAKALQYLSSPKWRIFKQVFLFIDGDDVTELSPEEMSEVYRERAFVHPRFGYVINDLDQISVAFEPGSFFETKKSKKSNDNRRREVR